MGIFNPRKTIVNEGFNYHNGFLDFNPVFIHDLYPECVVEGAGMVRSLPFQFPRSAGKVEMMGVVLEEKADEVAEYPPNGRYGYTLRHERPQWVTITLIAIFLFALFLRLWDLGAVGYGNTYYAAAVRSMLINPTNFFFVAFDPAGLVSVDKPPFALWVQAFSASLLGYSGPSLIAPQGAIGALSVLVLYRVIASGFGRGAGLLAALFLAVSPVSVAVDRSNNPDTLLVFCLLMAAWAGLRYVQSAHITWFCAASAWLAAGFQTKMLAAFLLLPGLGVACLLALLGAFGGPCRTQVPGIRRRHILGALSVLVIGCLWWPLLVELTPSSRRPWVGGSIANSALELVLDYNGIERVAGGQGPGAIAGLGGMPFPPPGGGMPGPIGPPGGGFPGGPAGPNRAAFGGEPGADRLFRPGLGDQWAWLLVLIAGVNALTAFGREKISGKELATERDRNSKRAQDDEEESDKESPAPRYVLTLLIGWGIVHGVVFSLARGIFHPYYLSALAPATAGLAGIGAAAAVQAAAGSGWRVWILPLVLLGSGIWQVFLLWPYPAWGGVLIPISLIGSGAGAVVVSLAGIGGEQVSTLGRQVGFTMGIISQLVAPIAWCCTVTLSPGRPMLPTAGPDLLARSVRPGPGATGTLPGGGKKLLAFLRQHRGQATVLLAAGSATEAAPLIAEYGEPIIALGGFSGNDPAVSLSRFQAMVRRGEVRYVLVRDRDRFAGGPPPGWAGSGRERANSGLFAWVASVGRVVDSNLWQEPDTAVVKDEPRQPWVEVRYYVGFGDFEHDYFFHAAGFAHGHGGRMRTTLYDLSEQVHE